MTHRSRWRGRRHSREGGNPGKALARFRLESRLRGNKERELLLRGLRVGFGRFLRLLVRGLGLFRRGLRFLHFVLGLVGGLILLVRCLRVLQAGFLVVDRLLAAVGFRRLVGGFLLLLRCLVIRVRGAGGQAERQRERSNDHRYHAVVHVLSRSLWAGCTTPRAPASKRPPGCGAKAAYTKSSFPRRRPAGRRVTRSGRGSPRRAKWRCGRSPKRRR